jgi:hypothetical protein
MRMDSIREEKSRFSADSITIFELQAQGNDITQKSAEDNSHADF